MVIKPSRWRRGKSLCAYCGDNVCTDGDHVVPGCLYTPEERQTITNMLTVPSCRGCNARKSAFDSPLQHYLLMDVDASEHPTARQIFETKVVRAVSNNQAKLLDGFLQGQTVPEYSVNGLWTRDLYMFVIDSEPVTNALLYQLRGLHFLVFGETKRFEDVNVKIIERSRRLEVANQFCSIALTSWHSQGDVCTVAWIEVSAHVYWLFDFYDRVLCLGRSVKSLPLCGPCPV